MGDAGAAFGSTNLHSNMVRFIINTIHSRIYKQKVIYIPIWLDLLCIPDADSLPMSFIYIPIWLDLLFSSISSLLLYVLNLHSNMVRFIIPRDFKELNENNKFTFQYG